MANSSLATQSQVETTTFDELESNVQSYARSFPVVFNTAEGAYLFDENGNRYIDFLAGAGSLNYGHNNAHLRSRLIEYISNCGITHSLDMHTTAKEAFLTTFNDNILAPRGLEYVVQFTGPTGTNAVEAALKLARNIKQRHNIIAFTNGFHGVSIGAMAATGNSHHRGAAGLPLTGVTHMPFCNYFGDELDTIAYLERMLDDPSSGIDHPAAAIVETVQGEGGLNVATPRWLRALERVCRKHDMLLIVDDIQAGCGRTGTFFSFEPSGIKPDIVTLSKSLSGYGIPFAVTIFRPDLDCWKPGEHNGTFRGNNHAFVTATAALERYWGNRDFETEIADKARLIGDALAAIAKDYPDDVIAPRGRGIMQGLTCHSGRLARDIVRRCFRAGLVIETSGSEDEVVKCLPPLVTPNDTLNAALDILGESTRAAIAAYKPD
ncbi:MAG: diaminobutyrate--2-oxoglutarate transaminase [Gammaproteobacteria bacterium]|nr:diaminobutyrate--2-oxoglutarate transaminase [Gammaproteobacteria bacterium]MCP5198506.1 diaminobutyrate--2-oxoglutarate transaminase [Gammaproteobacteria bacterium]